jgi:hypothetical protein
LHPVCFEVSRCLKAQNHGEQNRVQNNRVWEPACGLTATVVEGVRFDEAADAIVVSARSNARGAVVADGAAVDHPVMTEGLVGHVGELSTLTPRPKLTHGYDRRAAYVPICAS